MENTARFAKVISGALSLPVRPVSETISLLSEGATVPFISRYRKERTGGLDEVAVGSVKDWLEKLTELEKRKQTVLRSIVEQGALTDELKSRIERCFDPSELEDLYLPYRPKRRTRAMIAREKGLEPLAERIMKQDGASPATLAERCLCPEVPTVEEALEGASDIIAEWVRESHKAREIVRNEYQRYASIASKAVKGKESDGEKYSDYFDFSEKVARIPSHRFLALARGEKEGFLRVRIVPDDEAVLPRLERVFIRCASPAASLIAEAVRDGYKRLLKPSMETETLSVRKAAADREAIRVFAENLRQLLLAPPLGPKRVLAIDPGYRTGCKVVCLDEQGALLHNETIYPHPPRAEYQAAVNKIQALTESYRIDAIAVGDGTAGRETEAMIRKIRFGREVAVFLVSEDGASVYSASAVARAEFPDYDVTVRGAVSIGRRLLDPLSELVKIDPKSIGVGQYQHDVDQGELKKSLAAVVESCVNYVGVDLNTASASLLTYVSGLGPSLAAAIVDRRREKGPFTSRSQLLDVPRLGAKAYEQCAGFLRIPGADHPLDNSAVHPESYRIVEKMARDQGVELTRLMADKSLRDSIRIEDYVSDRVGIPTLADILAELDKPGRDPRPEARPFEFGNVTKMEDLTPGMILPGIVTNVTAFGAFVDIGIKQDGLVHISQLADRYVSDPSRVVKLQQQVTVRVLEVDAARKRISLSMKGIPDED